MRFAVEQLTLRPLRERINDLNLQVVLPLQESQTTFPPLSDFAKEMVRAKANGATSICMIGGHVIRSGTQKFLVDLMERGFITCLAMNGAGVIHDFELSLIGATTESVARYIKDGQFGLWQETGTINDIISEAYPQNLGLGEALGKAIFTGDFPFKEYSLLATGYRLGIPVTVHVGIGYDIIHAHPNCDGAATGATSYRDFLTFAQQIQHLENGVVMNFGSAVMAPEVYLKALSMARNVAHQNGREIKHFSTLVCDLHDLPADFSNAPPKNHPEYYYRPWKTMLVRTVSDGGKGFYVKGFHADTIPALWTELGKISVPQMGKGEVYLTPVEKL
jgi:hypothetical protein